MVQHSHKSICRNVKNFMQLHMYEEQGMQKQRERADTEGQMQESGGDITNIPIS